LGSQYPFIYGQVVSDHPPRAETPFGNPSNDSAIERGSHVHGPRSSDVCPHRVAWATM